MIWGGTPMGSCITQPIEIQSIRRHRTTRCISAILLPEAVKGSRIHQNATPTAVGGDLSRVAPRRPDTPDPMSRQKCIAP